MNEPNCLEAEQQLLGAILVNSEAYHRVAPTLGANDFYNESYGVAFEAVGKMLAEGKSPNAMTVARVPGAPNFPTLKELTLNSIGVFAAVDFARVIREMSMRRSLIRIAQGVIEKANCGDDVKPDDVIEETEVLLAELGADRDVDKLSNLAAASAKALESIADAYKRDDAMAGLPTGLGALDRKLGGLAPSDLIILAARPGMGKSALACSIAYRLAQDHAGGGCPVGFFSLEMSASQLATRLIAEASGISSFKLRSGDFSPLDFEHLIDVTTAGFNNPFLLIDESGRLTIDQLSARARRMHRQKHVGLIVVDYLQLLSGSNKKQDRHVEVSEITTGLKALAKDLNVPILALSQLSREVEKRDDKRPHLADLRESGSIEQDADVVLFLYREEYYLSQAKPKDNASGRAEWEGKMRDVKGKAELIIGKQRHGPIGSVEISFDASLTKFSNLERAA
jgi:replicative DNA helicase